MELRVEKNEEGRKEKLQRDDILNKQISPGIVNVLGKVQLFRRALLHAGHQRVKVYE